MKGYIGGIEAQIQMAPVPDLPNRFDLSDAKLARQSAVMILLYMEGQNIKFPLIVRPEYDGVHSGQVALPGGKHETEDNDLIQTALRETNEEIGVSIEDIQVLGCLSELFVPPSNFNILPVVGVLEEVPDFIPETAEVKELIIADIDCLNDKRKRKRKPMSFYNGTSVEVPYFDIKNRVVWGATAMILSELATIINTLNYIK